MKNKSIIHARSFLLVASLLLLTGALAAQAQTTYLKANNTTVLTTSGSWTNTGIPGSGDIGRWNNTVTAANVVQLGAALGIGEIQIANPGGAVTIWDPTTANVLTLNGVNGVGIDMSAATQNLTIQTNVLTLGGNQTWSIASGRTLTLAGNQTIKNGANNVTVTGGGTLAVSYLNTSTINSGAGNWAVNGSTLAINIGTGPTQFINLNNFLAAASATLTISGNSAISLNEASSSGTHNQTFASLTLNPGSSIFSIAGRGSSSQAQMYFNALPIRNDGGLADFPAQNSSSRVAFGGTSGTVFGYGTFAAADFVKTAGAAATVVAVTYTSDTWASGNNTTVTTSSAPASGADTGTLRFGAAGANTVTLSGVNTIDTGAILANTTVGANAATITGGSLTSGNANADGTHDLIVINNNSTAGSSVVINSIIADNGGNSVGLTAGSTLATAPSGTIQLGAANTFSGLTYITKGTLQLNNSLALQNSTLNYNLPGTLSFGSLTAATFGGLAGSNNLALPASFTLTVGNNNANTSYSGVLTGAGATVTKVGSGTLTLNGANGYTGGTTVSQGALALGAAASLAGTISLGSSGTLDVSAAGNYSLAAAVSGTGTVNGALTLASGGQLSPTGTSGVLTLNSNLTLSGGTCLINFNAATPTNGIITIGAGGSGNLTLNSGTVQLNITGGTLANGTYKIIGVPHGTITGSGSVLAVSGFSQPGQAVAMVANSGELDLVVSTYVAQNLLWVGDGSANLWNVNGAANWNDLGPTAANPSVFKNSDKTTLDDSSANTTVNLSGTLSPGSVTINGTQSYTLGSTGKISGSTSLTNSSSGTLTILTTNDYSGGTVINSGIVQVGNGTTAGGAIGSGSVLDNGALVFDLPGGSQTSVGAASGSGTLTLTTTGNGTLLLNGADILAGATTITAGTIRQGAPNVLPNGVGVGDMVVNGTLGMGGQNGTINGLTGSGTIDNTVAGSPTLTILGSSTVNPSVFSGLIKNTVGTLALNFNGIYGNVLQLTTNNTYTGGTTITTGTLQLGDTNAISSGSLNVLANGTLDLNGFGPTVDALTGSGIIDDVSAGGTATLSVGNSGGSGTYSGAIKNSSGTVNLVKNGAGTETLAGINTYTGSTTVNAGILAVGTGGVVNGAGAFAPTAQLLVNGGSLTASANSTIGVNNSGSGSFVISSGSASFNGGLTALNQDAQLILITGGSFTATDVTLNRTAAFAAPTAAAPVAAATTSGFYVNGASANVSLGTLEIGINNSSASARVDAGTVSASGEVLVSRISGGSARYSILQVNGGTFNASDTVNGIVIAQNNGAAACNGEVYLSGGTTTAGRIGFGTATDTVGGNGWLFVNGGATLYVDSGGIVQPNTHGYVPTIELTSGTLGAVNNDWASPLPMNLNGTSFTIQAGDASGNPHNITLSGVLSETASASLIKTGSGTLTLSGANQYNSGTVVSNGTLNINGIFALGGANYAGLEINDGGALQYSTNSTGNGSLDLTLPAVSIIGSTGIWLVSGNDTIDVNGNNVAYANANGLFGGGQLHVQSMIPGGSLNLTGTNSYTSGTIVGSGVTLYVNTTNGSATGSGGVTVGNGGTLAGNGIIGGAVEIDASGVNAPGNNGVGTNTFGSLLLQSYSVNNVEFNGHANDQTVVTSPGGFTLNDFFDTAIFNLYQAGGTAPWTTPGTYNLIQFSGTAPSLDNSWTTVSGFNTHIGNPQSSSVYSFGISGGYLTLTIASSGSSVSGTWTNTAASGNWTTGANWDSNPNYPHNPGDSATFGSGTGFSTVTLNASETVGTMTFNNGSSYDIADAGNTLTVDNTPGAANIYVLAGTQNSIQTSVALNENTTIAVSSGVALSVSGIIANSPSVTETLTVSGTGKLALSGNNSYGPAASSGFGTTVSGGGTLQVGNNNALAAGDVSIAGSSTLQAGAAVNLGNNIDITSGATATVDANGNSITLGGVISDSGALTKIGNGTLTLVANNTYSGNTTVNGGVLSISSFRNVLDTSTIILNGGDLLGNIGIDSEYPNIGIGPLTGVVGTNALVDAASGQVFALNGVIATAGNTGVNGLVVNSGAGNNGMVILNVANTFGGTTVVSNGLLEAEDPNSLQNSTLNYNNQGGSLIFGDPTAFTLGGLTGVQNLILTNINSAAVTLSVGNNNSSGIYSGSLYDNGLGGALTKIGSGTFALAGINNYNGATTVSAGTLQITNNGVVNSSAANIAAIGGAQLVVNGGTLVATNASTVGNPSAGLHVTSGSATFLNSLTEASAANGTFISASGGSLTAGSLSLGRTGLSDTTQPVAGDTGNGLYVNGGTVNIITNLSMGTASAANSTVNVRVDSGSLNVGGVLTIGLNNGGRWSVVDISGGALIVTNTIIVGGPLSGDAELLIRGGTVSANAIGLGQTTAGSTNMIALINQTNGSLYVGAGGIVQVSTGTGFVSTITFNGGLLGATADWSCTNNIQLTGSNYTIQTADASGSPHNIYLGGTFSGVGGLIKSGAGTLVLSNADTCTGTTTISNGTLALVPGGSVSTPQIGIGSGATFDVSALAGFTFIGSSPAQTLASASTSGTATVNATGGAVTLVSGAKALFNAAGGASPTVGKILVTGDTVLNANVITVNVNGSALGAGTYRLLDCTGTLSGSANATPVFTGLGATPGASASISTTAGAAGHIDLTVTKATPVLQTATASNITNGSPLSASVLTVTFTNATGGNVPGTAVFTSPGTVPPLGTANQQVQFTPTDTANYNTPATFNVSVMVVSPTLIPTNSAGITGFNLAGTNVVISATNGNTGATYYLLTTTNLVNPINHWKTVWTNVAGGANFSFTATNVANPNSGQQFYLLSSTNY